MVQPPSARSGRPARSRSRGRPWSRQPSAARSRSVRRARGRRAGSTHERQQPEHRDDQYGVPDEAMTHDLGQTGLQHDDIAAATPPAMSCDRSRSESPASFVRGRRQGEREKASCTRATPTLTQPTGCSRPSQQRSCQRGSDDRGHHGERPSPSAGRSATRRCWPRVRRTAVPGTSRTSAHHWHPRARTRRRRRHRTGRRSTARGPRRTAMSREPAGHVARRRRPTRRRDLRTNAVTDQITSRRSQRWTGRCR